MNFKKILQEEDCRRNVNAFVNYYNAYSYWDQCGTTKNQDNRKNELLGTKPVLIKKSEAKAPEELSLKQQRHSFSKTLFSHIFHHHKKARNANLLEPLSIGR